MTFRRPSPEAAFERDQIYLASDLATSYSQLSSSISTENEFGDEPQSGFLINDSGRIFLLPTTVLTELLSNSKEKLDQVTIPTESFRNNDANLDFLCAGMQEFKHVNAVQSDRTVLPNLSGFLFIKRDPETLDIHDVRLAGRLFQNYAVSEYGFSMVGQVFSGPTGRAPFTQVGMQLNKIQYLQELASRYHREIPPPTAVEETVATAGQRLTSRLQRTVRKLKGKALWRQNWRTKDQR